MRGDKKKKNLLIKEGFSVKVLNRCMNCVLCIHIYCKAIRGNHLIKKN